MENRKRKAITGDTGKKRADNWQQAERITLFQLVSEKVHIIEDKKTDANAVKKKTAAWNLIHDQFSAACPGGATRTIKQLKEKWKNLKGSAKVEISDHDKEVKKTGGGPPPEPPSELSQKIKELLPKEFTQLCNPYDDDAPGEKPSRSATMPDLDTEIAGSYNMFLPATRTTCTEFEESREDLVEKKGGSGRSVGERDKVCQWSVDLGEDFNESTSAVSSQRSSPGPSPNIVEKRPGHARRMKKDSGASVAIVETQFLLLQKEEHDKKMKHLQELHLAKMDILGVEKQIAMAKLHQVHSSTHGGSGTVPQNNFVPSHAPCEQNTFRLIDYEQC